MKEVRISLALIIAIALQWSLPNVFSAAVFIDFPLLIIVYVALQRESFRSIIYATVAGIAIDGLSDGLLGATGFSLTITAFVVAELARRVLLLDNPLLKIPVLAGASALNNLIYFSMHQLLGQTPSRNFPQTMAYSAMGTCIVGTVLMLLLEFVFSDRAKLQRRANHNPRRNNFRRNPIRLNKRV